MKTSISVPDDLWDCVKDTADGPSAVVQEALSLLCQQRKDLMAHAPSDQVKDKVRDALAAHVERLVGEARQWSEEGYELGVALARHLSFADLVPLTGWDMTVLQSWFDDITSEPRFWVGLPLDDYEELVSDHLYSSELVDCRDFWGNLSLALRQHLEAIEEIPGVEHFNYSPSNNGVIATATGQWFEWVDFQTPDDWWMPAGDVGIGTFLAKDGKVPPPYLSGMVGALVDLATAVADYGGPAVSSREPVEPEAQVTEGDDQ